MALLIVVDHLRHRFTDALQRNAIAALTGVVAVLHLDH